jgi:hypothetical protein
MMAGAGAALLLTAMPAFGTPDDRWLDTPTGWTYLYGATTTQIGDLVAGGQRIFNIERLGLNSYNAIGVTNSGGYNISGMSTIYSQTSTSLSNYLSNNNRRIIDLEPYENGATENFTAITVPNTGDTGAGWGWLFRTSPGAINNWIANANPPLRLIDMDVYTLNGTQYYSAVAVNNTGAQSHGWWFYFGRTAAQVTDLLTQNGARLVDIEVDNTPTLFDPPTFTVIMIANNPGSGWWYSSLSQSQIGPLLEANGARLTCMEQYTNGVGQTRFAVAMVDNTNAETGRIRDAIRADIPTGDFGFMSKEVGGPVVTSLNENFQFEPASMIKILHSARAMREVQVSATTLDTQITLNTTTTQGNSCPVASTTTFPTLRTTIQQVMRNSSNQHTEALRQRYGTAGLNNFADAWNLDSTGLNHTIGCICSQWPNFNTFTARDAVSLYEQLADGSIINEDNKDELFTMMLNYNSFSNNVLTGIINQEAAGTDLTGAEISAFRTALDAAWKGGSYTCNFANEPSRRWRTEGGWASIPFKGAGPFYFPFDREYAVAVFLNESNDVASVTDQIYNYTWETIRLPIRQALQSWDAACGTDGILQQPQNDSATEGSDAQFSVTIIAQAGTRNYRWQRFSNGGWVNLFDGVNYDGADTSSLTVFDVEPSDAGAYRVRITKECGETLSQSATLTVTEACDADFDGNGRLNFFDFSAFIAAYNSQSGQADLAPPFGVWNFFDVSEFISLYNAGCP